MKDVSSLIYVLSNGVLGFKYIGLVTEGGSGAEL